MSKFLIVTWNDIEELTLRIVEDMLDSQFFPDVIVGILRGGWVVARLVSDYLDVEETGSIGIKFYSRIGKTIKTPLITQPLIANVRDKKVLIVDDVSDSGRTLQVVTELAKLYGPKQIKTASLYIKPWTLMIPDYYAASTEKWIFFPWEPAEILREIIESEKVEIRNRNKIYEILKREGIPVDKKIHKLIDIIEKVQNSRK